MGRLTLSMECRGVVLLIVDYTRDVKKHWGGAVEFEDMHTGAKVTLQSSELLGVRCEEAEAALHRDRSDEP